MSRALVRLRDRYPTVSRMTLWRIRKDPAFPDGIDVNGTEYFREGELDDYEETRRRRRQQSPEPASAAETESTPQ